ncbi:SDR family NAD(P)-dependent oxidoreductase [Halocynthiibacter sp. C4]|uniref:SDR family NAD(P)-dependent oxidoreductase n=1 Tax=Halocynthiibacter sp. C4 TaxID=2992758 RepID=UPI00237BC3B1|nr:SDR family oxidoreductase [Halocynthiibacter sp. C4]MDE0591489.1 SDR family NAD(P)-dependent oxidoreductase [Halocynthiibacter sp. C4]
MTLNENEKTNERGCIVITGAAKGIGRAVADFLAKREDLLVLVDLECRPLAQLAAQNPDGILLVEGSVADPQTAKQVAQAAMSLGGARGLSHNAGIQRYGTAQDTSLETWDEVFDVNLRGAFLMAQALLPQLVQRRGSIVFMSSVQGLASQSNVAAYTSSKHALNGLTKSIAVDFAEQGVRANAVAPGSVNTPMLDWAVGLSDNPDALRHEIRNMHPLGRAAEPSEIASVVSFLLSEDAAFVTGEVLRVDGGLLARIPGAPSAAEKNDE